MPDASSCGRCWAWSSLRDGTDRGECRAGPPVPIVRPPDEPRAVWPLTRAADWCRSFVETD
ncbi:MAG: hypothetical protein AB7O57_21965 [Hyphomicrobiaceae bacterium]